MICDDILFLKIFSAKMKEKKTRNVYTNENILFLKIFSAKMKNRGTLWRGGGVTSIFGGGQVV